MVSGGEGRSSFLGPFETHAEPGDDMTLTKRIAPLALAATIAVGGVAAPSLAATSSTTHWTTAKCTSYKASFLKRHKKPTKKQLAAANKTLKRHGCTIKA
jgi:hypothetical protein